MRSAVTFFLLLAGSTAAANAQSPQGEPVCKADQTGDVILTTVQYQDGYRVEAPWRVTTERKYERSTNVTAVLDHIIETDRATKKRETTPLPGTIRMTFKGSTSREVLQQAADIWCSTVSKAMAARASDVLERRAEHRVVM